MLEYRLWDSYNKKWLDTSLFNLRLDTGEIQRNGSTGIVKGIEVDRYIGIEDWFGNKIFENDIIRVYADRVLEWNRKPGSKFDKRKIETRSIVVFNNLRWELDTDTEWNNDIIKPMGGEKEKRILTIEPDLSRYKWSDWDKQRNNHMYNRKLIVIGNTHEGVIESLSMNTL